MTPSELAPAGNRSGSRRGGTVEAAADHHNLKMGALDCSPLEPQIAPADSGHSRLGPNGGIEDRGGQRFLPARDTNTAGPPMTK